jgi:hypothetical protein
MTAIAPEKLTARRHDELRSKGRPATKVRPHAGPSQPVPLEQAVRDFAQSKEAPSMLRVAVSEKAGVPQYNVDIRLMEALGTKDLDFMGGILRQLGDVVRHGAIVDERELNFMLSVIKSVKPRDEMECMLAAQMAAVHMASMRLARRLAHVEDIQQQDSAERAFNKLARTFTNQMEALKRYRTGGEQKVTVQHVSVSEGGQAIVGNVTQTPRASGPNQAAALPHALADAKGPAMTTVGEPALPFKRKPAK